MKLIEAKNLLVLYAITDDPIFKYEYNRRQIRRVK